MRRRRFVLAGLLLTVVCVTGASSLSRKPLTERERACVGSWSFPRSENPTITHVYELRADRRAIEHHYYQSRTPATDVPTETMIGVWSIDSDDRLTVEPAGGAAGIGVELSRRFREATGDRTATFRLLRRFYMIEAVEPGRITVTCSKSGGGGTETLTWERLAAAPSEAARP